jgi:hypothetical protein
MGGVPYFKLALFEMEGYGLVFAGIEVQSLEAL